MRALYGRVARRTLLLALTTLASGCGRTSNGISGADTNDPGGGRGGTESDGRGGATSQRDTRAAHGNSGIPAGSTGGQIADGGGAVSNGGTSSRTSGAGGAPATAGATSFTGSGGVSATGGSSSAGGFPMLLDPHAEERRQLAEQACSLGDEFPCLTVNTDPTSAVGDGVDACRAQTEADSYTRYGTSCWDEWVAHMNCGIHRTDYCPCTDSAHTKNYCNISPALNYFGNGCADTKAALDACESSLDNVGTETGSAGQFIWQANPGGGCTVQSIEETGGTIVDGRVGATCSGPPGGAQSCLCSANGHVIVDLVELTLTGGGQASWLANDCRDAATQLASGICTDLLSCCFRFNWPTMSGQNVDTCGCASDPSRAGYSSCQEFAAAAKGTIVDSCVEWQTPGDFPIQPKPMPGQ